MPRLRAAASHARSTRRRFIAAGFAFGIVAGGAACNPAFNWREFRSPDGFAVVLPGRPQTVSREIKLPDATVQMSMTSTGIGATLFAVGTAQMPPGLSAEPSVRQRTIAHLRDALVRNVNGSITKNSAAALVVPPGDARKVLTAEAIEATGRDSGGRAVQLAARLFIVDDRLFQVVALSADGELQPDALDIFFASFRLI
jgi:hypothetical protein